MAVLNVILSTIKGLGLLLFYTICIAAGLVALAAVGPLVSIIMWEGMDMIEVAVAIHVVWILIWAYFIGKDDRSKFPDSWRYYNMQLHPDINAIRARAAAHTEQVKYDRETNNY